VVHGGRTQDHRHSQEMKRVQPDRQKNIQGLEQVAHTGYAVFTVECFQELTEMAMSSLV